MSLAVFAAIFAGALIAIQSAIIGSAGGSLNPFVAAVWVHLGGLVFGVVGVLVAPRLGFEVAAVRQAPWILLAGVAGMLLVTGIGVAVAGLGLASTLAVVTGVQLLLGFAIEASGVVGDRVPVDPVRLLGALVIVAGVYLVTSRSGAPA